MSKKHEYFEQNPKDWNIVDFLNKCDIVLFDIKIDIQYIQKSLETIANNYQGC